MERFRAKTRGQTGRACPKSRFVNRVAAGLVSAGHKATSGFLLGRRKAAPYAEPRAWYTSSCATVCHAEPSRSTGQTGTSAAHKTICIAAIVMFVLTGLTSSASAQTEAQVDTVSMLKGITVETSVDRAEMFIGDLINYTLTITYDSTFELVPPPLGANLGSFDVKDYQTDQITRLKDGRIQSKSDFVLRVFTTGDYVIPPIPVLFNLPDGSRKLILSEAVPIVVNSLLGAESDSADIRPLKPPHEFKRDLTMYYVYGAAALLALILAALWLWGRLRRKPGRAKYVDRRKPWEIAFERLALLSEQNLMAQGEHKQYYIELTEIAREYLGRMYAIEVLEMTTDEFLVAFVDVALPNELYDTMRSFLNHADLVKFARMVPQEERSGADFNLVHDMVESVRVEFERRLQVEMAVGSKDRESPKPSPTEAPG